MIALDTNILVYAHRSGVPQHGAAQQAIERAASSGAWGFAEASVVEFWAVVTHAQASSRPSKAEEATAYLSALRRAGARVLVGGTGFADRLVELASDLDVRGPRILDLQIALSALDHGARELWTHDRDFVRVPDLQIVDPLA